MSMQSLKKIGQKVLKLEHGNEALTEGRTTDGRTDTQKFGGYNIIPRHFLCGYKKRMYETIIPVLFIFVAS